jgi:hypothetical protein
VNHLFCLDHAAERSSPAWSLWSAVPELGKFWRYSKHCTRTPCTIIEPEQHSKIGFADAHRVCQHRLEDRLKLARRSADHLENLRRRRLLLKRFGEIVGAPAQFVVQAHVFDGDDGLVSKILNQLDSFWVNGRTSWR